MYVLVYKYKNVPLLERKEREYYGKTISSNIEIYWPVIDSFSTVI